MRARANLIAIAVVVAAVLAPALRAQQPAAGLPARLTDAEFWAFFTGNSEPNGYFRSDNLTSNELLYQHVIGDLVARTGEGNVYLGVGPEQNYTYMAALKPKMAVIFDVRRGNAMLQLMYKALFEIAADRADFVAMLFARPRPPSLTASSSAAAIFDAVGALPATEAVYKKTLAAIHLRLIDTHKFPIGGEDLAGVDYVYQSFYTSGFALRSSPTYADLMTATDQRGVNRSYLATEANFAFLKDLQTRNLVIPVVGDFGGRTAIRSVGAWLKARGASVAAFYLSNVEQYLVQDGKWDAFCRNVAALPLTPASTFIRSAAGRGGFGGGRPGFVSSLGKMAEETRNCGGY